jgi:hypothetical protein
MKNLNDDYQKLVDAALVASKHLEGEEVSHCLVGRLGLAAHGYEAGNITDLELLLEAGEAFSAGRDGLCVTKAALPLSVGDVRVRWTTLEFPWEQSTFREELKTPRREDEVPIASLTAILCLLAMAGDKEALRMAFDDGAPAEDVLKILREHALHLADVVGNIYESRTRSR